jgi:hypothetical protein
MNTGLTKGVLIEYQTKSTTIRIHHSTPLIALLSGWQWGANTIESGYIVLMIFAALSLLCIGFVASGSILSKFFKKESTDARIVLTTLCFGIVPTNDLGISPNGTTSITTRIGQIAGALFLPVAILFSLILIRMSVPVATWLNQPLTYLEYALLAVIGNCIVPVPPYEAGLLVKDYLLSEAEHKKEPFPEFVATEGIARFGQWFSASLSIVGIILGNSPLIVAGGILFFISFQILLRSSITRASQGMSVADVMRPADLVDVLTHGMTISHALRVARRSFQEVFPVVNAKTVIGLVDRATLVRSRFLQGEAYVSGIMEKKFQTIDET